MTAIFLLLKRKEVQAKLLHFKNFIFQYVNFKYVQLTPISCLNCRSNQLNHKS